MTKSETIFVETVGALLAERGYRMRHDTYRAYFEADKRNVSVYLHQGSTVAARTITEREMLLSTPEAVVERLLASRY